VVVNVGGWYCHEEVMKGDVMNKTKNMFALKIKAWLEYVDEKDAFEVAHAIGKALALVARVKRGNSYLRLMEHNLMVKNIIEMDAAFAFRAWVLNSLGFSFRDVVGRGDLEHSLDSLLGNLSFANGKIVAGFMEEVCCSGFSEELQLNLREQICDMAGI